MTALSLDRRGIVLPPQLSRQPGLARGLVFRYSALDRDLAAWTPAGPVFGVLQNNAAFKATELGHAVDDPGEAAGGLRFPRTADTEGFHPSQPSGFRVSGELIFANDSWGAWSCIATTSDWNTGPRTYAGINFRGTGTGGLAIQLGDGGNSDRQHQWIFDPALFENGEVYHFVFAIYDPANGVFFLDGREITPTSTDLGDPDVHVPNSSYGYRILGDCSGGSDPVDGRVWMMNVWSRSLARGEILARFRDPLGLFQSRRVVISAPAAAWHDNAWTYRQKITIQASQVDADLADFPVMINQAVVGASLFTRAKADGSDLVVTAGDGTTKLARELVHYDAGGGLELYVKVPDVPASADTALYLYYGNAAAAEANDPGTWDASFGLVDHCETDPATDTPVTVDSTANGNHGVIGRGSPANAENDLWGGNAHEFFGADRLEIPDDASYDPTDAITVEVWVNADAWASRATHLRKSSSFILYNYSGGYSWYTYGPNHRQQYDIAGELGIGAWGHIVGTYDKDEGADNKELWLNGAIRISQTVAGALEAGTSDMGIGEEISGTADPFDGLIDEIRISTTKRSDAWITATYRNLSAPATFLVVGSEETEEGGGSTPAPRRPIIMTIFS